MSNRQHAFYVAIVLGGGMLLDLLLMVLLERYFGLGAPGQAGQPVASG